MRLSRRIGAAGCIIAILYVGSFLMFQAFPHEFSLADADNPQHYTVTFTDNADVHSAMRAFYWPLIRTIPGHRYYPTRDEVEQLRRFHDSFQSEGLQSEGSCCNPHN